MNQNNFDQRLTREQLLKLLARARVGKRGTRDHLMILLSATHGFRASEICDLRVDDIDLDENTIRIRHNKGSLHVTHPLRSNADPLLDEVTAVREYIAGKQGKLFSIGRLMLGVLVKKYSEHVGIPKRLRHHHVLRHTCAHLALEASGRDITVVQRYLGHKNLSSTGVYTQMSDSEASSRVKDLFGKS